MILIIDNYDSFVYNLARYVEELGYSASVFRNDNITLAQITELNPSHIILSPGPCTPTQAGISLAVINHFKDKIPMLGICLGHQALAQAFGGTIVKAKFPMHGKASTIQQTLAIEENKPHHPTKTPCSSPIFVNLPAKFPAARYHSLVVSPNNFPAELMLTATCQQKEIMAIQHKKLPLFGVQFHPESILTNYGYELLNNFLSISRIA